MHDRIFEVWYAVRELPLYPSPELFNSTVSDFLPAKLEPLGFSSTGQFKSYLLINSIQSLLLLNDHHLIVVFYCIFLVV